MFGGEYNRVTATISHNGEVIHHLHGHWRRIRRSWVDVGGE